MNKFFEEYGLSAISMMAGSFMIGLLFETFIGKNTLFSMVVQSFLGAFM